MAGSAARRRHGFDDPRARDLVRRHLRRRGRPATARCARTSAPRRTTCTRASAASCRRSPRGATWSWSCPVLEAALAEAGATLGDVVAIAVTQGPGLIGALLVGLSTGKALAYARRAAARAGRPPARPRRGAAPRPARARAAVRVPARLGRPHARARRRRLRGAARGSAARATTRRARPSTRARGCSV